MSNVKRELLLLQYGMVRWLEKDPIPDNQSTFSCYKESGWRHFLLAIFFLIGFESISVQVLFYPEHAWISFLHLAFVFYGGIWILGDYQAIKKNNVTITPTALHVRIGLRWAFEIPVQNILAVEAGAPKELDAPVEIKMNQFVSKKKIPGYEMVTVAGKPNLHLVLKSPITIVGPLGRKKTMSRLGLSIDEPQAFIENLRKKLPTVI